MSRRFFKKKKKKKTFRKTEFAVPAEHRVELKERENRDKYLDLARELKDIWNMKVVMIPIVIDTLRIITKGLLQGFKDFRGKNESLLIATLKQCHVY